MHADERRVTVLYSFPHKIGAGRICTAAWNHVVEATEAGTDMTVHPGAVARPLPEPIEVVPTLARGGIRIPYRLLGRRRALDWHDRVVAARLPKRARDVDLVHTWPSGALETLRVASELGIRTVLERPNAHTRFAFEVVREEEERLGLPLPPGHEHAFDEQALEREEREYELADVLLCPSEFVLTSFTAAGFPPSRLMRHTYGFDDTTHYPDPLPRSTSKPLTMLFVGDNPLRKGLHYALEAWVRSPASRTGRFLVVGGLFPAYRERFASMLAHPSVEVLGRRSDLPDLYRQADILVLPTIEEGSPLVCMEAIGCGCVPVVSTVCNGVCRHRDNALVHPVRDVDTLSDYITLLDDDRDLLSSLREGALRSAPEFTWAAAGRRLARIYGRVVDGTRVEAPTEVGAASILQS